MNKIYLLLLFSVFTFQSYGQENEALQKQPVIRELFVETSRPAAKIKQEFPYDIALKTEAGDSLNTAGVFVQNGKPTVLAFWLTTCVPCLYELKAVSQKYEGWKKEAGFNYYAISIDFPKNYGHFAKRVEESQWPFPAYWDMNREFQIILPGQLNGLPQTFVLDKNGRIVHHTHRYLQGDEDRLFEFVKSLQ